MRQMTTDEVEIVGGAVSSEAAYGASLGVSGGLLALGLTVTAPAWGTALLLGGSIAATALAINYVLDNS